MAEKQADSKKGWVGRAIGNTAGIAVGAHSGIVVARNINTARQNVFNTTIQPLWDKAEDVTTALIDEIEHAVRSGSSNFSQLKDTLTAKGGETVLNKLENAYNNISASAANSTAFASIVQEEGDNIFGALTKDLEHGPKFIGRSRYGCLSIVGGSALVGLGAVLGIRHLMNGKSYAEQETAKRSQQDSQTLGIRQ